MEEQIAQLWKLLLWGFGTCVTGFLFLAGWMWTIVQSLEKKVTYEWIETTFQKNLNCKVDALCETVDQIRDAIIGDFQNKGLMRKVDENKEEIVKIKLNCDKLHGK